MHVYIQWGMTNMTMECHRTFGSRFMGRWCWRKLARNHCRFVDLHLHSLKLTAKPLKIGRALNRSFISQPLIFKKESLLSETVEFFCWVCFVCIVAFALWERKNANFEDPSLLISHVFVRNIHPYLAKMNPTWRIFKSSWNYYLGLPNIKNAKHKRLECKVRNAKCRAFWCIQWQSTECHKTTWAVTENFGCLLHTRDNTAQIYRGIISWTIGILEPEPISMTYGSCHSRVNFEACKPPKKTWKNHEVSIFHCHNFQVPGVGVVEVECKSLHHVGHKIVDRLMVIMNIYMAMLEKVPSFRVFLLCHAGRVCGKNITMLGPTDGFIHPFFWWCEKTGETSISKLLQLEKFHWEVFVLTVMSCLFLIF